MLISLHTHSTSFNYHKYHNLKCFDTIMHIISKFWRTINTSIRLVLQSGDTSSTLGKKPHFIVLLLSILDDHPC
jgi:hypothetical protein